MMTCEWILADDDYNIWDSACGQAFNLEEGNPQTNNMSYCCFCGCKIILVEQEE